MTTSYTLARSAAGLLEDYKTGVYFQRLVNHPEPHPFQSAPEIVLAVEHSEHKPAYSIVMPVFDQENNLSRNLGLIEQNARLQHDWIFIDDGSSDRSIEVICKFIRTSLSGKSSSAIVLRNAAPVFETACDNIGFSLAVTETVIEIQADIQILEAGFDEALTSALARHPRASAASGRAGHAFVMKSPGRLARLFGRESKDSIGLMGTLIENPAGVDALRGYVYEAQTVNRGPWALRKADLIKHGYLDQAHFFLGDDDHDFHRRLFEAEKRSPLYVPMKIMSRLVEGATRRTRDGVNAKVYDYLKQNRRGSLEFQRFIKAQKSVRVRRLDVVP